MKTAIVIPARYGSTRFPGKPLALIGGRSMLARVADLGRSAAAGDENVSLMVATDDARIEAHCREIGVACVMTPEDCPTGSDRVLAAAQAAGGGFDFLISLQGDAPFTPPAALAGILATLRAKPDTQVATPVIRLDWAQLDKLREYKKTTPFSGTTVTIGADGRALWFSKNILPAIRKEDALRQAEEFSPVHQHIGLYAYRADILARFVGLPQGRYEKLEGLEQLRLLENGIEVTAVPVDVAPGALHTGIDSPEDLARAEAFLAAYGDGEAA
jgi:3-deoxy-manno-octulosonate cytidylyltransferase (CMP-KDO synthetase)